MLSRVAESLYWMARYIERAEAVARLAAVDFQALLDGTRRGRLEDVVRITSDAALFRSVFPSGEEAGVLEFLHAHPANPSGVLVCLSRARENARGMREQISSEMWEHLNRLYLLARDGRAAAMAEGPYAFFRQVRDGTQAFEGITAATMTHAPAYEFIQLGRYLERAVVTIRTLAVRYEDVCMLEDGSAPASLELITLLKS
ncbi:MAG TPA: alpha-E domain-containing protein, partial [Vicinamibacteria bacterium]|nr:alpha-E domain-containing protein [Vicinamibacteria bacterium]